MLHNKMQYTLQSRTVSIFWRRVHGFQWYSTSFCCFFFIWRISMWMKNEICGSLGKPLHPDRNVFNFNFLAKWCRWILPKDVEAKASEDGETGHWSRFRLYSFRLIRCCCLYVSLRESRSEYTTGFRCRQIRRGFPGRRRRRSPAGKIFFSPPFLTQRASSLAIVSFARLWWLLQCHIFFPHLLECGVWL